MSLSGQQYRIAAGDHAATIVEVGAGIRHYTHRGRDVTLPYGEDEIAPKGCGAVLVPWPNRIREGRYTFDGVRQQLALTEPAKRNASHGLARWARWTPVRQTPESVTLGIDIVPQPGWPFELRVDVTYLLDEANGLRVTAVARNLGAHRLPFGIGFHPYVAIGSHAMSSVSVELAAAERLLVDDAAIPFGRRTVARTEYDLSRGRPLGRLRLDDAFTGLARADGRASVVVRATADSGARVWMDQSFPFVQVFTAESITPGVGGVAVEPMSCPADAFNSGDGLLVLEPRDEWVGNWGIEPLGRRA
jgi:aldose 1-epimerase